MNEDYIKRLINLVEIGRITVEKIKDENYRLEVEKRLNQ